MSALALAAAITLIPPGVRPFLEPADPDAAIKALSRLQEPLEHQRPEQAPEPLRPARAFQGSVEDWRSLVGQHFTNVDRALCIIGWESTGDPNAASDTDDHGLFQIHWPIWGPHFGVTRSDLYNPKLNTKLAAQILNAQGWTAWSAVKRGIC